MRSSTCSRKYAPIELDERLATGRRGVHQPGDLLGAATGEVDRCAIDLDSVRLAGFDPDDPVPMIVAAATAADVTDVVIDGRPVVRDRASRVDRRRRRVARRDLCVALMWDLLITDTADGNAIAVEGDGIAYVGPDPSEPAARSCRSRAGSSPPG